MPAIKDEVEFTFETAGVNLKREDLTGAPTAQPRM